VSSKTNGEAADPYHLQRFVDAQSTCFGQVRSELLSGQKRTHWMWFVFPQLSGLGGSLMSRQFAISGPEEASAYLLHATLGERLRDCTALVNAIESRAVEDIFAYPDNLKVHSSITLFAWTVAHGPALQMLGNDVFAKALARYFNGQPDGATILRLEV
jgi:uncharacterized protein (DUF1810 family)